MTCYFVFEGIDDSGKTTLIQQLAERLRARDQELSIEVVREPYDFPREVHDFFSQIGLFVNNPWLKVYYCQVGRLLLQTRLTTAFRAAQNRAQQTKPLVLLQDRSFISTMVYQAYDLNLDHHPSLLESFWRMIVDGALREAALPDLVLLMEPPPESSLAAPQRRLKELYREAFTFLEREYSLKTQPLKPGLWQDPDAYEAALAMLTDLTLKTVRGLDKPVNDGV